MPYPDMIQLEKKQTNKTKIRHYYLYIWTATAEITSPQWAMPFLLDLIAKQSTLLSISYVFC